MTIFENIYPIYALDFLIGKGAGAAGYFFNSATEEYYVGKEQSTGCLQRFRLLHSAAAHLNSVLQPH